jgi:hypothetical protein
MHMPKDGEKLAYFSPQEILGCEVPKETRDIGWPRSNWFYFPGYCLVTSGGYANTGDET